MSTLQSFEARLERALDKIAADHRETRDDQPADERAPSKPPLPGEYRQQRPTFATNR